MINYHYLNRETAKQLQIVEQLNIKLTLNEQKLENKIQELNRLNNNLLAINESLGLEDADIFEQLEAINTKKYRTSFNK